MRLFLSTLSLLLLAAIVWVTLASLPQMTTVSWIPKYISRWADAEPTFPTFLGCRQLVIDYWLSV